MTPHDIMPCRRCRRIPRHIDVIATSDTGVQTVEYVCAHCGYVYRWMLRHTPDMRAILADERRCPPARLRRLRAMEGIEDA